MLPIDLTIVQREAEKVEMKEFDDEELDIEEDRGLTLHHVPVQQQSGITDCGVFAVAFCLPCCNWR